MIRTLTVVLMLAIVAPVIAQDDAAEQLKYARGLSAAFRAAADRIEPSVAHITTRTEQIVRRRDFFGRPMRARRQYSSGLGSGVVISEDGYILSNAHVVENATELLVRLHTGREYPARLVGTDPKHDLAVLKIDESGLTPATFVETDTLDVGEWVLAVGSPFGYSNTVTAGIVSARGPSYGLVHDELSSLENYIQTDAAINPGNSGGPLINLEGEVVGVNTAIFSRVGGSVGLGFAIPADVASKSYKEIIRTKARGWLGVEVDESEEGVIITATSPNGPASIHGVLLGDLVRAFNGQRVRSSRQLVDLIQASRPGAKAQLELIRNGKKIRLEVELGDWGLHVSRLFGGAGFRAQTMTSRFARELGVNEVDGVVVTDVRSGGIAEFSGLRPRDVIVGVQDLPVANTTELDELLRDVDFAEGVRLRVIRKGRRGYLDLVEF